MCIIPSHSPRLNLIGKEDTSLAYIFVRCDEMSKVPIAFATRKLIIIIISVKMGEDDDVMWRRMCASVMGFIFTKGLIGIKKW